MSSALRNLSEYDPSKLVDASGLIIGIAVSDYYTDIAQALYSGCVDKLMEHGVKPENIHTVQVPGAFELPAAARMLNAHRNPDALICIGCVIKGETSHNEYINQAVATGLINLSLASGKPCIFGVLTPNDEQQALDRAGGKHGNKGVEAAVAALRMAQLKQELSGDRKKIGFGS